jgi:streptolysin S family bacteriocin protoxin
MLKVIDRVEEKYFTADATVAPGGWCCHCHCCVHAAL